MREFVSHIKKLDWILIASAIILMAIGLLSIYGSSLTKGDFFNFQKQLIFAFTGLFLVFLFSFLDYRTLKNDSYFVFGLYFASLLALIGLFFFAPETRGVKGWYKIGPLSFDPIEFAKIILIILLAKYFSTRHIEVYRIKHILFSGLYIFLPAILVFLRPDSGSTLILVALWLLILVISGIKLKTFLTLLFCGLMILAVVWSFLLKDYQKERIWNFVSPQADLLAGGWSQNQSKIAIGSGGVWGQGLGKGPQTQYGFLSEPQTDFIFAAIAEEFGFWGVSVVLSLFLILIWRIIKVALASRSNFPRLFAVGLAGFLVIQIFINIGMNLGLLPIIGISLPLVSYGGSGLIAICIGLGVLQSIKTH